MDALAKQLSTARFTTRDLTFEDGASVQRLLEACADFYDVVLGRPPGSGEANALYVAGPEEGADPNNKILLGISHESWPELIGVLDAFRDYPQADVWYIGLLLFIPQARGSGVGKAIVESLAAVATAQGARELQLNVVEQNAGAYRFWKRVGFEETRRWRQHFGERESTFIRMRRSLLTG